jgi:hypothetical protein
VYPHNTLFPSSYNYFVVNRYATIDRRPIDPPPVVLMKLFAIDNAGTDDETEEEFENYEYVCGTNFYYFIYLFFTPTNRQVRAHGMICSVDLFPVPDSGGPWTRQPAPSNQIPYASSTPNNSLRSTYSPENRTSTRHDQGQGFTTPSSNAPDVVWHHRDFPITESSKLTSFLVGATFVEPCLIDYQGKMALLFVFAVCIIPAPCILHRRLLMV